MKAQHVPTVEELNQIQADWMALQVTDPKATQDRVMAAMKAFPSIMLSVSADKQSASVMVDSMPMWAHPRPIAEAKDFLRSIKVPFKTSRDDVGWCGSLGQWVSI